MTAEAALPVLRRYRFTVEEYEGMAEHGLLPPDERLELIAGEVIQMSPIGWRHARCVNKLNALLVQALSGQAVISVQNPVILSARDEPQPDLAVLRLSANQHPGNAVPADVFLLIEVADSTLAYDQRIKLPLYARSGIAETWIVDVDKGTVTQYTQATAAADHHSTGTPRPPLPMPMLETSSESGSKSSEPQAGGDQTVMTSDALPQAGGYRESNTWVSHDTIVSRVLSGLQVRVSDILP